MLSAALTQFAQTESHAGLQGLLPDVGGGFRTPSNSPFGKGGGPKTMKSNEFTSRLPIFALIFLCPVNQPTTWNSYGYLSGELDIHASAADNR
jgi:hypothetical protein